MMVEKCNKKGVWRTMRDKYKKKEFDDAEEDARKMKQKMEEENGHRVWRNGGSETRSGFSKKCSPSSTVAAIFLTRNRARTF